MNLPQLFKPAPTIFLIGKTIMLILLITISQNLIAQTPDIFISCNQIDAVRRYDGETGVFKGNFVTPGSGGLDRPQFVFFHPMTGHLLVTGFVNAQIKMYDGETGAFLGNFSSGYDLSGATKMILGPDSLLYISQWDKKVVRFTLDGNFVDEFTTMNIPAGLGMVWDDEGHLYVAGWGTDGFDGQVYQFDSQGNSLGAFITASDLDGPVGIWRNEAGHFLVVDWRKGAVLRFGSEGVFQDNFITGADRIEGNAFGADGSIYICNVNLNKINRYHSDGSFQEVFIDDPSMGGPNAITFGPMLTATDDLTFKNQLNIRTTPNPFSTQTSIQFDLPSSEFVTLKIRNAAGQEVTILKEAWLSAGQQEVVWKGLDFPTGTYFIHLNVGEKQILKQVMLVK